MKYSLVLDVIACIQNENAAEIDLSAAFLSLACWLLGEAPARTVD